MLGLLDGKLVEINRKTSKGFKKKSKGKAPERPIGDLPTPGSADYDVLGLFVPSPVKRSRDSSPGSSSHELGIFRAFTKTYFSACVSKRSKTKGDYKEASPKESLEMLELPASNSDLQSPDASCPLLRAPEVLRHREPLHGSGSDSDPETASASLHAGANQCRKTTSLGSRQADSDGIPELKPCCRNHCHDSAGPGNGKSHFKGIAACLGNISMIGRKGPLCTECPTCKAFKVPATPEGNALEEEEDDAAKEERKRVGECERIRKQVEEKIVVRHRHLIPYYTAEVLMIRWGESDTAPPPAPMKRLENVFVSGYYYNVKHCVLPRKDAERYLADAIAKLINGKGPNDLIILYYAGPAHTNATTFTIHPPMSFIHPKPRPKIDLKHIFETTFCSPTLPSDVLLILDAPFACPGPAIPQEGKEILAATTKPWGWFEHKGYIDPDSSTEFQFTLTLCEELEKATWAWNHFTVGLEERLRWEATPTKCRPRPGLARMPALRLGCGPVRRYIQLAPTVKMDSCCQWNDEVS